MARQISVTKSGMMADVLEEAKKAFDDADTEGDVMRRLAIDWYRNRQPNSKRAALARLEETSAEIKAAAGRLEETSAEIKAAAGRTEETSAYTIACMSQMSARIAALEANTNDLLRLTKIFPDSPFKVTNGEPVKK